MFDEAAEVAICKTALKRWGTHAQLDKAVEECSELITAILRFKQGRAGSEDVAEEVADVEIMCRQLRLIVGNLHVSLMKEAKLDRLKARLEDPKDENQEEI